MNVAGMLVQLEAERDRLNTAIAALKAVGSENASHPVTSSDGRRGPRRISAAARRRISQAQKARWAAVKGKSKSSSKSGTRMRRGMSAAARKRMSEMMKARWAAKRRAGKAA